MTLIIGQAIGIIYIARFYWGKIYILFLTNNTPPLTKREGIRKLILAQTPTEKIAKELQTSKEYIYKERGKLKREGLLPTHQSLAVSDGQQEITVFKSQSDLGNYAPLEARLKLDRTSNAVEYDIPSISQNDIKSMYTSFQEKRGPAYVIAKFGFRPDLVEREYERYMSMVSRDPFGMQRYLISQIVKASPKIQLTVEKSTNNLLTNDEIISIINHIIHERTERHLKNALIDASIPIPEETKRFRCRSCNRIEAGVLLDTTTKIGSFVYKNIGQGHTCSVCMSIKEEAYAQAKT